MTPVLLTCPICNKQFYRHIPPSKAHRIHYCSRKCADAALRLPDDGHVCEVCGKRFFDRRHPDRRFCSQECTHEAQKRRIVKTCPTCGKAFKVRPKLQHRVYCSRKCYRNRELPSVMVTAKCAHCGAKYETRQCRPTKYCSLDCKNAAQQTPENYVTLVCRECGEYYQSTKAYLAKRNSYYCSIECRAAGMSKRKRGAKNPNYRGGSVEYRGPNWRRVSRLARKRDGYTCQICGKKPKGRKCHVHHIKPYRDFNGDWSAANDLSNLITLCSSCHSKVEHGDLSCPQLLFPT